MSGFQKNAFLDKKTEKEELSYLFNSFGREREDCIRKKLLDFLGRSNNWQLLDWEGVLKEFLSRLEFSRNSLKRAMGGKREKFSRVLLSFSIVLAAYLKNFEFYLEKLGANEKARGLKLLEEISSTVEVARDLNKEFSICVSQKKLDSITKSLTTSRDIESVGDSDLGIPPLDAGSFDMMLSAFIEKKTRPAWFSFQYQYEKHNSTYEGVNGDFLYCGTVDGAPLVATFDATVFFPELPDSGECSGVQRKSFQCDHVEPWKLLADRLSLMEFVLNLNPEYRKRLFEKTIRLKVRICDKLDAQPRILEFSGSDLFCSDEKIKDRFCFTELAKQIFYCNQNNLGWLSPFLNLQKSDKCPIEFYLEELSKLYGKTFSQWVADEYQVNLRERYARSNTLFFTIEHQGEHFYLGSLLRKFSEKHHQLLFRLAELIGICRNHLANKILSEPQDGSGQIAATSEVAHSLARLHALCENFIHSKAKASSVIKSQPEFFDRWLKCLAHHHQGSFATILQFFEELGSLKQCSQGCVEVTEAGNRIVGWFPSVERKGFSRKSAKRSRLSLPGLGKNNELGSEPISPH